MEYLDLDVRIGGSDEHLGVRITSPDGEAAGVIDLSAIAPLWQAGVTTGPVRHVTVAAAPEDAGTATVLSAVDIGRRLFDGLFSDRVRGRLDGSLGRMEAGADLGLRIRIHLDPRSPAAWRLQALPWELLCHPEHGFLAVSHGSRISIVRHLQVPRPAERDLPMQRLSVLLVLGDPSSAAGTLDLSSEQRAIERALRRTQPVDLEVLRQPTLDQLRDALRSRRPVVLHYMGHGELEPDRGGSLRLGPGESVPADRLGRRITDLSSLQLVVLNACLTSRAGHAGPFSGVGPALVQAGVPAVVGMRAAIGDRAAIAFAERLYAGLAAGDPIDAGVAEGRMALYDLESDSPAAWSLPVLFLRSRDRRIAPPPPAPLPQPPSRPGTAALALLLLVVVVALVGLMRYPLFVEPGPLGTADRTTAEADDPGPPGSLTPAETSANPAEAADPAHPTDGAAEPPRELPTAGEPVAPAPATTAIDRLPAPGGGASEPSSRADTFHSLTDGGSTTISGLGSVTVDFLTEYGVAFVRLTLIPDGDTRSTGRVAVLAPGVVVFSGVPGEPAVRVLEIDWPKRHLRLARADG